MHQPGAIQILLQFFQLFRREASQTVLRQRIRIHCCLADQVMTNLADAVRVGLTQAFNGGLYFTQETVQLKAIRGFFRRCFQTFLPVN